MKAQNSQSLAPQIGAATRLFRTKTLALIRELRHCNLVITDAWGQTSHVVDTSEPRILITVHDPQAYRYILLGGNPGVGESYALGMWECEQLTELVRLFLRNRDILERLETGLARFLGFPLRALHELRRNTRSGAKANIAAHYDLGNAFFASFLDDRMQYSSAIFTAPSETLEQAQENKLRAICDKLDLQASDHLLEIGTGWGGLAEFAATRYGCRVTTTTISAQQAVAARARIERSGLSDRVTVLEKDYRDLTGSYDKLVSVEMIEAVGARYLPDYLTSCAKLLRQEGAFLLQAIVVEDRHYRRNLRHVDFIQRFIFPGSFIPSVSAILAAAAKHTDFGLFALEDIGTSYAKTLATWRERFEEQSEVITSMGFNDEFRRLWRYYFCYCEGGFLERSISDVQMLLVRPKHRPADSLSAQT